jgi:hypothetical protein
MFLATKPQCCFTAKGDFMTNIDLTTLTVEELETLAIAINSEIKARNNVKEPVLYYHDCISSARNHKQKNKHWSKIVSSVDTTKTNGYAFEGIFLDIEKEHKVPYNAIVIEVCGNTIKAFKMLDETELIATSNTDNMSHFIEKIATLM